ncbi:MAG: Cytidyltransferase-related protein [Candidatus Saccharibacteria bacterium]|nr:Cytidyltransferase-related protein [Candidatus Saccharibacteria bacterium]
MKSKRIGIYAGTFDPIHAGHLAFALQAISAAELDHIYFLPERKPRDKQGVEHFGHRVAMLNRAVRPHPQFEVIELVDISLTVKRTLTELAKQFPKDQLVFLMGSDVAGHLPQWPHSDKLLRTCELVIGIRDTHELEVVQQEIESWATKPLAATVFTSHAPEVTSSKVRDALRTGQLTTGLLTSVAHYSNKHWLYVSVPTS